MSIQQGQFVTCARVVAKVINEFDVLPEAEWVIAHPQGEDESAQSRITAIASYRVVHVLAAHAKRSTIKATKFFGMSVPF